MTKKSLSLRNVAAIAVCLAVCTMFSGCTPESSDKQITAFGFSTPPAVGVIDETAKTIAVPVPLGTNVTALSPVITVSPDATVSPASGVANNFSQPVVYTVTAADGSKASYAVTVTEGEQPVGNPQELTFPITQNKTLPDLGLDIDYVVNSSGGDVTNNATLTIEPGVTIQFKQSGGHIEVKQGACIKAIGTEQKRIKFIGVGTQKGSWDYIRIASNSKNEFVYCDFINGGKRTGGAGVVELWGDGSELNMRHCKISGGLAYGLYSTYLPGIVPTFENNVIEGCVTPVYLNDIRQVVDFDMTSTYTNNTNNYVEIYSFEFPQHTSLTINRTSVPYFISSYGETGGNITITEGVTFYMDADAGISIVNDAAASLTINGTAELPVTFTRLPGSSYYWASSGPMGIQLWKGNHTINHCIIEYGAGRSDCGAISMHDDASLTISNTVIRNSKHYGFKVSYYTVSINHTNVTFANNADGNVYWHDGQVYTQLP